MDEAVPGCFDEGNTDMFGHDFCAYIPDNYLVWVGNNDREGFPLDLCEGDCNSDDECGIDLICHYRNDFDEVPGCKGNGRNGIDFCIHDPDLVKIPTEAPTTTPAKSPTDPRYLYFMAKKDKKVFVLDVEDGTFVSERSGMKLW